jgi:hypothetical protein
MIEWRSRSFVHEPRPHEWDEWHVGAHGQIQRCLFDDEGFLLATETLEGDVADLVTFATAGSNLSAHDVEAATWLNLLHGRRTGQLLQLGTQPATA